MKVSFSGGIAAQGCTQIALTTLRLRISKKIDPASYLTVQK